MLWPLVGMLLSAAPFDGGAPDALARVFVTESAALPKVLARFARDAKKPSTADLGKAWRDATVNAGAFRRVSAVKNDRSAAPITTVDVTCEFARARVVVRLLFDDALRLHGLLFHPH